MSDHLSAFAAIQQAISGDKTPKTGDRVAIARRYRAIAHEGIGDSPAQTGDKQAIGRLCAKGLSRPLPITPGAVAGAGPGQLRDCPWGVGYAGLGSVPSSVVTLRELPAFGRERSPHRSSSRRSVGVRHWERESPDSRRASGLAAGLFANREIGVPGVAANPLNCACEIERVTHQNARVACRFERVVRELLRGSERVASTNARNKCELVF